MPCIDLWKMDENLARLAQGVQSIKGTHHGNRRWPALGTVVNMKAFLVERPGTLSFFTSEANRGIKRGEFQGVASVSFSDVES